MEVIKQIIAALDPAKSATISQKLGTAAVVVGALIALLTAIQEVLCKLGACIAPS